jgi:hypothetical protein
LKCHFAFDTVYSSKHLILNNTSAQLLITDFGYAKISPMRAKSEACNALQELIQDVGIPEQMHTNGAIELTHGS